MLSSNTFLDLFHRGRPLLLLLAVAGWQPASAIDPKRTLSQYVREAWSVGRGFPKGPVYAIEQTRDGYLWIGAEKGLIRFDGLEFVATSAPVLSSRRNQPPVTHVLGLLHDAEGHLWGRLRRLGLTVFRYDGDGFQDVMREWGRGASVAAMARAHDGNPLLWLLQQEPSVAVLRNGKLETLASPKGFSRSPVLALAQTGNGDIWVGTRDAGLYRIREGKTYAISQGLPDPKVNALAVGPGSDVWVGTDSGVVRWDGTQLTRTGIPPALDGMQILALLVDRDRNLWVGSNSHGVLRLNADGLAALPQAESQSEAVTALFEDREGSLWVGSSGAIQRWRDSPFVTHSLDEGLDTDGNNPLLVDEEGRLWFAPSRGGLSWFLDGKHGQVKADGLERDLVYTIAGHRGEIWAGRQHGGLTQLRRERGIWRARTYRQADGLAQDSVYAIYPARDGAVWAGTLSGGVSRLYQGKFTNYTAADGLASDTITSLLETRDGAMWFATPAGLTVFRGGKWQSFTDRHGLPTAEVNCLLEDAAGRVWVGSAAGLAFQGKKAFQTPEKAPPALREAILGLAEDEKGYLWIATANRVLRVSRNGLVAGKLTDGDLREFGLADGLRGLEGVKRHRSVVKDSQGRVWFSLNRGISVVDPVRLASSVEPALVHIQNISADGRSFSLRDELLLPGGSQRVAFRYAGLSLSVPERVRFRYMLEGFDRGWSQPVATREAVYTNLGPRAYRFRISASNPDGVWNAADTSVAFVIAPLFWQTTWFRLASLAAFGLLIAGAYLFRMRQLTRQLNMRFEERLAERTRIAQELHDTLLQGFLSANMQLHVATDRLPEDSPVKPALVRVLDLMGRVIDEGRNAVRGLRATVSGPGDLAQAFSRLAEEFGGEQQVDFRVIVDGEARPLRPILRDETYRIGREALANAFRHAGAKRIEVELAYSEKRFRLLVRDNGVGIEPRFIKSGRDGHWGLAGMRERAERIGGQLHLWSSAATGTEIEFTIPRQVAFDASVHKPWDRLCRFLGRSPAQTE